MKVAVTGATGFVGRALVHELAAAGHEPIAICRSPGRAADLGVEVRAADLRNPEQMQEAMAGCDAVIANAALAPGQQGATDASFMADNVTGAENHLAATAANGIRRLIWVSTIAVYRTRLFVPQDEHSPQIDPERPRWDWNNLTTHPMYARSKAMAERRVWDFAKANALELTVLRPGPVYGPGDAKLTGRYARTLARPIVTGATVEAPHVHVSDVALAAVLALGSPRSIGRVYNLGGSAVSPYRFLRTWRDALGWSKPVLPFMVPLRVRLDDRRAQQELGWRPRSLDDAMPGLCEAYFDGSGALR